MLMTVRRTAPLGPGAGARSDIVVPVFTAYDVHTEAQGRRASELLAAAGYTATFRNYPVTLYYVDIEHEGELAAQAHDIVLGVDPAAVGITRPVR
jgi:hypothetical protein